MSVFSWHENVLDVVRTLATGSFITNGTVRPGPVFRRCAVEPRYAGTVA